MKYCNQCKLAIDTSKERYVKVEDNEGNKNLSKLYFHKKCWHELMTQKNASSILQKQALGFLNFAKKKLGYDEEQEGMEVIN